ncbi:hypothetical protein [Bradyrhizobium sp. LTSP857]|uniref:hypothetical protein n=1 Tax=Bradyrhizobium sp. LTSP857 TaxID=1619231 RepID=UPI0005D1863C|nr:hypothetical protein [Bradyrhizobium sp. LTSP857]KJC42255.1 hypothetical protein UP06_23750 [Bradyrhizobium sp. LTSP857]
MARRPCTFKQQDLKRALQAVRSAGIQMQRVEIDDSGKFIIIFATEGPQTYEDELDRELAEFRARHGKD